SYRVHLVLTSFPTRRSSDLPEFVRRQLQGSLGQDVSLKTIEYLEGNPQKGGRMTPRLIGFLNDAEREFFEAICSVDGVGVKTALDRKSTRLNSSHQIISYAV